MLFDMMHRVSATVVFDVIEVSVVEPPMLKYKALPPPAGTSQHIQISPSPCHTAIVLPSIVSLEQHANQNLTGGSINKKVQQTNANDTFTCTPTTNLAPCCLL